MKNKWLGELKPHALWYLIALILGALGVDAAISAFVSWTVKRLGVLFGIVALPWSFFALFAVVLFGALGAWTVLTLLLYRFAGRTAAIAPKLRIGDSDDVEYSISQPSPPKSVDLQGEILELYISRTGIIATPSLLYIVLKVRVVNHGPDETTIMGCGLHISLGQFQLDGEIAKTPPKWHIKKKKKGAFNLQYEDVPIDPYLGANPHAEVYRKGIPREGWLAFEVYLFGDAEFPNAQFELFFQDALRGEHHIRRLAGVYERTGELVIDNPASENPPGH
jgi:hypothetical protein